MPTLAYPPMLASIGGTPLDSPDYAYEPKYDGIRAIAVIEPPAGTGTLARVTLWSRLGNDKTAQFRDVADALARAAFTERVVLDGEIVALDRDGEPAGFQNLQGRMHVAAPGASPETTAFIAFDLLIEGDQDLRRLSLRQRRPRLAQLLKGRTTSTLRLSEQAVADGRELHDRAMRLGWEGLLAKRLDSPYQSGKRSPDWRKLKLVRHQTCVIGGWTEPRGSRPFFGALLLGVYDDQGALRYIGHTGGGFTDAELGRIWKRLHALRTKSSPFAVTPKTNERPHWTRPALVVEVKFTEWTSDDKLRHPTYLGVRDDVKAASVKREPVSNEVRRAASRPERAKGRRTMPAERETNAPTSAPVAEPGSATRAAKTPSLSQAAVTKLLGQLDAIEHSGGDGVLDLPGGARLDVTNLRKPFWPAAKNGPSRTLTKGDLFRHYVRVAPFLLPTLADRPLVMKRYPNGVGGKPFYQHRAPDTVPAGVRVDTVATGSEERPHLIGGALQTLLYTAQLASISQDPWFSRVGSLDVVDHIAIDLDPPDGLPFDKVLDVARWVREELDALGVKGFAKTSGSGGLHVYVPMPPGTPYDAGLLYCQIVATLVAKKHPKQATVERSIAARGRRIYVDYLQNIQGKTLASAYSPRANAFAGVSTPLTWDEVDAGVRPQDFTVENFPARLAAIGDLWATLRKAKGADLRKLP